MKEGSGIVSNTDKNLYTDENPNPWRSSLLVFSVNNITFYHFLLDELCRPNKVGEDVTCEDTCINE